jgi:hypothetical protein
MHRDRYRIYIYTYIHDQMIFLILRIHSYGHARIHKNKKKNLLQDKYWYTAEISPRHLRWVKQTPVPFAPGKTVLIIIKTK